ncbi:hypothetical protein LIER_27840 [Lithospermum erythrorhizon]|uniref:RNase H type-1 domain-containing protein n=1 Tax=Lithospermum erythrorhizon TaxID=34254 RepID=A0AAV3RGF6_LITER
MKPPNSYKEVQKLTGCLATLTRFISKSGERNLPFFRNLRRWLTTWAIDLSDFELSYLPRTSVRVQALADFVTEWTAGALPVIQGLEDGVEDLLVKGDSKLVIDQIRGSCGMKNEKLMKYHAKVIEVSQGFKRVIFEHIPRTENERTDRLSRLATTYYSKLPEGVYIEICDQPAYNEEVIKSIAGCNATDWSEPITEYLTQGVLPSDSQEAKKVEVMNRIIFKGIKKNILQSGKGGGTWIEELPIVLWSLRSTPNQATGETPFSLVYGTGAVLPTEVGLPTYKRFRTAVRLCSASQPREQSKLSPKWEGTYRVKRVVGPSTFELEDLDGKAVPRTWHASKLCRYYV